MTVQWQRAPGIHPAFYADVEGRRLFVEQTVRSRHAARVANEFQASIGGVRLGEFGSLKSAQSAAIAATQTKTALRG